jgi:hypothetical protein
MIFGMTPYTFFHVFLSIVLTIAAAIKFHPEAVHAS